MRKSIFLNLIVGSIISANVFAMGGGSNVPRSKYAHLDPKKLVPKEALEQAVSFYDANPSLIANKNYITIIDFTKYSGQRRFFVINMQSGEVEDLHTSHGVGSDPSNTGYADKFSNVSGSKATSLGFYLTGGLYEGSNGTSMYLDGLSASNSNARPRAIVVHGANYVSPNLSKMGRSWGCPALDHAVRSRIYSKIKGKSLFYAWKQ